MVSCPPRPTMQSASSVPTKSSSLAVPMIGFRPLAKQKATGSAGCALACPSTSRQAPTIAPLVRQQMDFITRLLSPRVLRGIRAGVRFVERRPFLFSTIDPRFVSIGRSSFAPWTGMKRQRWRPCIRLESARLLTFTRFVKPASARALGVLRMLEAGRPRPVREFHTLMTCPEYRVAGSQSLGRRAPAGLRGRKPRLRQACAWAHRAGLGCSAGQARNNNTGRRTTVWRLG
jgi:hypothetical protein